MATAKLEAVLEANITPFQQQLEKARKFAEGTGDVTKDLFKELSGFDLGKALGIAGATYAATKLGEALIVGARFRRARPSRRVPERDHRRS
jgi:hypothetical protein